MPPSNLHVTPSASSTIGKPIHFLTGPFANRTIRTELEELQKADLGRKCGNRDRRPLDPPPVVRIKLFEVLDDGAPQETEREVRDLSELVAYGYICFVDLFPWPPPREKSCDVPAIQGASTYSAPYSRPLRIGFGEEDAMSSGMTRMALPDPGSDSLLGSSHSTGGRPTQHYTCIPGMPLQASPGPNELAACVNGVPVMEHSSSTEAFVGATFVSASCIVYQGIPTLLGVFPDLAVNMDGTFILRYRTLNLFSASSETRRLPVLAECWGGPVIVYPTKDFPGLAGSTELTKYLSAFKVPVNIRQSERGKKRSMHDLDQARQG